MLKKLRNKFVRIALFSLVFVVFIRITAINMVNLFQSDNSLKQSLTVLAKSGELSFQNREKDRFLFRYFLNPFKTDGGDVISTSNTTYFVASIQRNQITDMKGNFNGLSQSETVDLIGKAYSDGRVFGFCDNYYRYVHFYDAGTGVSTIALMNYERSMRDSMKLAGISIIVGIILIVILAVPIFFFAKRAVNPVERSIEKRKQFITDASHELKTPLAIISANAEVLEMTGGENEWITSIKNQTSRLSILVRNLVTLSKLEETRNVPDFKRFNLSDAVIDVAKAFETPAKTKSVDFILDVRDNIMFTGSESEIRQLVSILCDNAVKYVTEGGIIKITCKKKNRTITLEFFNDCENIEADKLPKLFDRFYRTDNSRNSLTGGHGVGLSIARVVVERNKGAISAVSTKPNSITFVITF